MNCSALIEEHGFQLACHRIAEPVIHDVDRKAAFFSAQNLLWQEAAANAAMQPFSRSVPYFERRVESFYKLYDFLIEIRHSAFQAMHHRQFVRIQQKLIRQRRSDL